MLLACADINPYDMFLNSPGSRLITEPFVFLIRQVPVAFSKGVIQFLFGNAVPVFFYRKVFERLFTLAFLFGLPAADNFFELRLARRLF